MFTKFAWTLTSLLGLCVVCLIVYIIQPELFQQKRDPSLFLLPDGYEGVVTVNFGQKGYPPLEHEGNYIVFPIPKDGVLNTSTPEPEYGWALDKYVYVDEQGQRRELSSESIQGGGIGNAQIMKDGHMVDLPPVQYFHVATPKDSQMAIAATSYPEAVLWADSMYLLSVDLVTEQHLGVQLGEVKRQMQPMPYADGDANSLPVGTRFYAIKGSNQYEAIAVECAGVYKKAIRQETFR